MSTAQREQVTVDGESYVVLEADYHRNGVGGAGFYVGIIANEARRYLITAFPEYDNNGSPSAGYWDSVAVVDLDMAADGNVYMHPANGQPGGNAWRGADRFGEAARAIVRAVHTRYS